ARGCFNPDRPLRRRRAVIRIVHDGECDVEEDDARDDCRCRQDGAVPRGRVRRPVDRSVTARPARQRSGWVLRRAGRRWDPPMGHRAGRGASDYGTCRARHRVRTRMLRGCAPRDHPDAKGAVMPALRRVPGFSTIELLIASAVLLLVVVAVFGVAHAAPDAYAVDSEVADMHQRLRVGQVELVRDLAVAQSIHPYRWGGSSPDPPGTFKSDTITTSGASLRTHWLKRDDTAAVYQLMSYSGGVSLDAPAVDNIVALAFEYFGDPRPPHMIRPLSDPAGASTTYGPPPARDPVGPFAAGENCVFVPNGSDLPDPRLPALAPPGVTLVPLDSALFVDGPWCPDDLTVDRWDAD